ncbi:MAG: sensor domain-containing phosphodiesterase [Acidimicrobiia bacterium]|nr:sensor domain-containing phosphodiesterase [Acidimicrobiia bacterium]
MTSPVARRPMSLNRKLLLLLLLAMGVLTAGWFLVTRALAADARDTSHADLRRAARFQITLVDERLSLLENRFTDMSTRIDDEGVTDQERDRLLEDLQDTVRAVETIVVADPTGRTTTAGGGLDLDDPHLAGKFDTVTVVPLLRDNTNPRVVLVGPITDGMLYVEFAVDLVAAADRTPLAPSEEVLLVARGGEGNVSVIDRTPTVGDDITLPNSATDRPEVQALSARELMIVEGADYSGVDTLAAIGPVDDTEWGIVVKIDTSDISDAPGQLIRWVSFLVLAVTTAVVVGGFFFIRTIAKRLAVITRVTRSIGSGDLGATIDDGGNDELSELADTIDQLSTDLRNDRARREVAEAALEHQTRHDPLTGLPNRMAFMAELEAAIDRDPDGSWSVLFCDLDGFKAVNDGIGHNAGDILLERAANRFRNAIGHDVVLARFGGDEFLLLCPAHDASPMRLAADLEAALVDPIEVGNTLVDLNASIGIATHEPGDTADLVLRNADLAMYRVKQQRKSAGLGADSDGQQAYGAVGQDEELRRAIEEGSQLRLLYQPIVDLTSGAITGVEALVRWHHPGLGLLNPKDFLPRADASGLLGKLDFWVLERSCAQVAAWDHAHRLPAEFVMSVNLSPAQLSNPELGTHIDECLRRHSVPPELLQIEITEHSLVTDDVRVSNALTNLRELGVLLAIDDFGTLYANLDRIRNLEADVLKIDQSFVQNLTDSPDDRAIIDAIVKMAAALNLRLIAEGIERVGQANVLRQLGCRYGQGFYFGNPRSPEATAHLLTHGVVGITIDVTEAHDGGTEASPGSATVNAPL